MRVISCSSCSDNTGIGDDRLSEVVLGTTAGLDFTLALMNSPALRFQSVTALDVVQAGGWSCVLVAGADDGITVFAMTGAGRLVHLATVEDRADLSLASPTDPMAGGVGTPALAAAVSETGGLGSLGAAYLTPTQIREAMAAVRAIPPGAVAGYGEVARRAGVPGRARLVAKLLSNNDDADLPWHRVLRSDGRIAFPDGSDGFLEQSARLRGEGVAVERGRVRGLRAAPTVDDQIWGPMAG